MSVPGYVTLTKAVTTTIFTFTLESVPTSTIDVSKMPSNCKTYLLSYVISLNNDTGEIQTRTGDVYFAAVFDDNTGTSGVTTDVQDNAGAYACQPTSLTFSATFSMSVLPPSVGDTFRRVNLRVNVNTSMSNISARVMGIAGNVIDLQTAAVYPLAMI